MQIVMSADANSVTGLTDKTDLNYGNKHMFEVTTSGICTISIPRYTVIYSIEVLNPVTFVTKTITSAGWATYCSPYALDFREPINNLTKAYYITGVKEDGVTLTLSEINGIVPPRTGILLQGEGECKLPVLSASNADTQGNLLIGVLEQTVVEAGTAYVLMNEEGKVRFYRNNKDFTVGKQTAYIDADDIDNLRAIPALAHAYNFFEEDINGISEELRVKNEALDFWSLDTWTKDFANAPVVYDLQGRRVVKPTKKGIYIISGKKVIIK